MTASEQVPAVSIVMPARNAAPFVEKAIVSVCKQTFSSWELLVIEDASDDETRAIITGLAASNPHIRLFINDTRLGVAACRNIGMALARGKYIAFLDSDDLWHPEKLVRQVQFIESSGSAITFSSYLRITSDGRALCHVVPPASVDYHAILRSNFIGNLTALFDRHRLGDLKFKAVGNEDHLFWIEALKRVGEPVLSTRCDFPLAMYRVSRSSLSGNKLRSAHWQWQTYRRHLKLGFIPSIFYLLNYIFYGVRKRGFR